jgi:glutaredoxin-like protein NrdH
MAVTPTKVEGKDTGEVMLYALSTCGWCKKTKLFFKKHGIAYSYVDVDLVEGKDREDVMNEVKKWNPRCSFPTIILKKEKCIVGFDEAELGQAFKL